MAAGGHGGMETDLGVVEIGGTAGTGGRTAGDGDGLGGFGIEGSLRPEGARRVGPTPADGVVGATNGFGVAEGRAGGGVARTGFDGGGTGARGGRGWIWTGAVGGAASGESAGGVVAACEASRSVKGAAILGSSSCLDWEEGSEIAEAGSLGMIRCRGILMRISPLDAIAGSMASGGIPWVIEERWTCTLPVASWGRISDMGMETVVGSVPCGALASTRLSGRRGARSANEKSMEEGASDPEDGGVSALVEGKRGIVVAGGTALPRVTLTLGLNTADWDPPETMGGGWAVAAFSAVARVP